MNSVPLTNNSHVDNVYRVNRVDDEFSRVYPEILGEVMTKDEYIGYLKRLEKACRVTKKVDFILIIPFVLFPLPLIVGITTENVIASVLCGLFWFAASFGSMIFIIVILAKMHKRAVHRAEAIIEEINQRFKVRGVRFVHTPGGFNGLGYIEIVLTNPNSKEPSIPDPWAQMSYPGVNKDISSQLPATNAPYPLFSPIPSAPPPSATGAIVDPQYPAYPPTKYSNYT